MGNPTEKTQICIIWLGLTLPLNARSKFSEALHGTKAPLFSHPANQFPATGKETRWQQARVQGVSVECKGDRPGGPSWRPRSLPETHGRADQGHTGTRHGELCPLADNLCSLPVTRIHPEASELLNSRVYLRTRVPASLTAHSGEVGQGPS